MPRIPLYNQGQGPTQRLATGQLSQRADVGAFTAPGRALAQFGQEASQIAFNFGMAERDKQDKDAVEANKIAFRQASEDFRKNNKTDNYEEFKDKYSAWQQGWIQNNTKNFSSRRKRLVVNAINPIAGVENLQGQNEAFRLSEANGTQAMNDTLKKNINIIASFPIDSVEHQAALKENEDIHRRNKTLGRSLVYSPEGEKLEIANKTFKNNIDDADSIEKLNAIKEKIDKSKLPIENIIALKSAADKKLDYYQTGAKIELDDEVADLQVNALSNGIETNQINSLQQKYIKTYGEVEGKVKFADTKKKLIIAKNVYSKYKAVEFSSFTKKTQAINEAFLEVESAPLDQKEEKQIEAIELQKKILADNNFISKDPVQFILNKNRGREFTSFARVTEQKKLGLSRKEIKLYTNNEMSRIKTEYDSLDTANQKREYLVNLKNKNQGFEEYLFPQMFANGFGYAENLIMLNDADPLNESLLASVGFVPQANIGASLKKDFNELAILVTGEFQDFSKSIQGDPMIGSVLSANGRSGSAEQIQTVIIDLAKYLKSKSPQEDNNTIVDKAMSIINSNYDIEKINNGYVRIPKNLDTSLITDRLKKIITSRDFVKTKVLLQGNLQPESYKKLSSFSWVTNDDETGVRLINTNAGGSSVLGKDNKPIELSFQSILEAEKSKLEDEEKTKEAFNAELRKRKYGGRKNLSEVTGSE